MTARSSASNVTTVTAGLRLPVGAETVFRFHADVRNLPRLTPGPVQLLSAPAPTRAGDLQVIQFGRGPLRRRWEARITRYEPPRLLVDTQERGPFRFWRHTHAVAAAEHGALLRDRVEFSLFPGPLGLLFDRLVVSLVLRVLFAERHRRTRRLLAPARTRART